MRRGQVAIYLLMVLVALFLVARRLSRRHESKDGFSTK